MPAVTVKSIPEGWDAFGIDTTLTSVCESHHPVCAGQSLAKLLLMAVPNLCGQGYVLPL